MAGKAYGSVAFATSGLSDASLARFNGALIEVRTGTKPASITDPATGTLAARAFLGAALQCDTNGQNCVLDPTKPAGYGFGPIVSGRVRASMLGGAPGAGLSLTALWGPLA